MRETQWAARLNVDKQLDDLIPFVDEKDIPISQLPRTEIAWPEVASTLAERELARERDLAEQAAASSASVASDPAPGMQPSVVTVDVEAAPAQPPGRHWLTNPALLGKRIDVLVRDASVIHKGKFDNSVGVIQCLEKVKRGARGSVQVLFDPRMATKRFIPIVKLFPLTSNEFEGVISAAEAQSILEIPGMYVLVIGPDVEGRVYHVGKVGYVSGDLRGVSLDSGVHAFPLSSLCRSDANPRRPFGPWEKNM